MEEVEGTTTDGPVEPLLPLATPFRTAAPETGTDVGQVCPFLEAEAPDGSRIVAIGRPHPANRCVALGEAMPQSDRQQELVCLVSGHVNCPRYLRGVQLIGMPPAVTERQRISPVVIAAALVLAASLAASFGFLLVRGGFDLPIGSPGASQIAVGPAPTVTPGPTVTASPMPTPTPTARLTPSASPTPAPSPSPSSSPTPAVTPRPTPAPTPQPSSNRYALLKPCPGVPNCWIYTVRSGDNLRSIANYFGVSYDRMIAMNPRLSIPIHAGDSLRIPTPTR